MQNGIRLNRGLFVVAGALLAACGGMPVVDGGDAVSSEGGSDIVDGSVTESGPTDAPDVANDTVVADAADVRLTDGGDAMAGDGGCRFTHIVMTTTDFTTGGFATGFIATRELWVDHPPPGDAGVVVTLPQQDHAVRTSGCFTFDMGRTFASAPNQVTVMNLSTPFTPRRIITLDPIAGTGDAGAQSANPHDVGLLSPTKAYVALYNGAQLAIVDPTAGTRASRNVDLSPLADADGIPEADSIAVIGNRAFVTLQQLDRRMMYRAPANSTVAVVDGATDALVDTDSAIAGVQGIRLSFGNPNAVAVVSTGTHLLVTSTGNFGGALDGGIDVIDVATLRVVRSIPSAMLGGEPNGIEWVSGTTAWVSVGRAMGDAGTSYVILAFDVLTGVVASTPIVAAGTIHYGAMRRGPDGNVWVIDGDFGLMGAVQAYSPTGTAVLTTPFLTPGSNTNSIDFGE